MSGSALLLAAGALLGMVLVYGVVLYNALVTDRNRVYSAWSDVEVQLKRRHELIPKLVDTVRQYAAYEQATLEGVATLRARSEGARGAGQVAAAEQALGDGVRRLFALVESYPDLKADAVFLDLQQAVTEVEAQIQYARRYYNGAVRALNTRVEQFPDLLLARVLSFHAAGYFELDSAVDEFPAGARA
jgi:LemA protein